MLMPFPELLTFQLVAPALLRFAAAGVFLYVAYMHWQNISAISRIHFPIVGSGRWIAVASIVFHAGVGAMLFFGYYTQIAALLGIAGSIKGLFLAPHYPQAIPLSRTSLFLLCAILFSLLLTGAGLFAFDLPL